MEPDDRSAAKERPVLRALLLGAALTGMAALCPRAALAEASPRNADRLAAPPPTSLAAGDTLTVLFTAETHGNLEPCACPERPLGGMPRRVRFLRETARSRGTGPVLLLDAGGFLPEGEVPLRDDPRVAARYIGLLLRGLLESGLHAGALDAHQRAFLSKLAPAEAGRLEATWLESDPPGPARFFEWKSPTTGTSTTLAVLALEESLSDSVVARAARASRRQASALLVLARADAFSGRRLARLSGADLVLLSRGARPVSPLREGSSVLVGCGIDGREIGEARLIQGRTGLALVDFRLHPMDSTHPDDPALAQEVRALLEQDGVSLRAWVSPLE